MESKNQELRRLNVTTTRRKREASGNEQKVEYSRTARRASLSHKLGIKGFDKSVKYRRDLPETPRKLKAELTKKTDNSEGTTALHNTKNPVLQAFDLMTLLIGEREKSLRKSRMKRKHASSKTSDKREPEKRGNKGQSLSVKDNREKIPTKKQKKPKKHHSQRTMTTSKKSEILGSSTRKSASGLKVKYKSRKESNKVHKRRAVQILKAMPRKELRNLLKEKGLGKYWNVVKILPKKASKRKGYAVIKFHGKNSKKSTAKNVAKRTRLVKRRKDSKKKFKAKHSKKKTNIHMKRSKQASKTFPTTKKGKISSTKKRKHYSEKGKKRSSIPKASAKLSNFQESNRVSKKRKDVQQNHKFAALKDKIKRANKLKFKVAQALLAHCATQNNLRNIFRDVNVSLKKAAVLVETIGAKLGMKKSDVEKITNQHPEQAVQQFLNDMF